jgi:protocadherin Fat 4
MVDIEVTDVNDEAPVFDQPRYYFDILEDTPLSSSIGQITATDADEGSNSEITYSILSHWGREKFSLDPHDGIFTLNGDLDFEEVNIPGANNISSGHFQFSANSNDIKM